ncbi:MAG: hypothetical protein ACOY3K_07205 [Candidatus Omnitrophota bacterium]
MELITQVLIFITAGVATWFMAEYQAREKSRARIHALEIQNHETEAKAARLRDDFEKLYQETQKLEAAYAREQKERNRLTDHFRLSSRALVYRTGILFLFTGMLGGALAAGLGTGAILSAKHQQESLQREVESRFAKQVVRFFKKEINRLERGLGELRMALDEERAAKTIAMTKLEILLQSLTESRWGKGFSLDIDKFKTSRGEDEKDEGEKEEPVMPLPRLPVMRI